MYSLDQIIFFLNLPVYHLLRIKKDRKKRHLLTHVCRLLRSIESLEKTDEIAYLIFQVDSTSTADESHSVGWNSCFSLFFWDSLRSAAVCIHESGSCRSFLSFWTCFWLFNFSVFPSTIILMSLFLRIYGPHLGARAQLEDLPWSVITRLQRPPPKTTGQNRDKGSWSTETVSPYIPWNDSPLEQISWLLGQ